ncbi:MAG TPA: aldehyde dehydrogenase family protein [Actinocrinis sp.]|jgi:aldehyde dehydrogenase (NAD+)
MTTSTMPITNDPAALREQVRSLTAGQLYIDGVWREASDGARVPTIDPSTENAVTTVASGTPADTDAAVDAARRAFDEGGWGAMNPIERGRIIARIGELMADFAEDLAIRETIDVGKPITPTRAFDVPQAAVLFGYYGALAGELDGASRPGSGASMAYTRREPLGVVGAITPFNFPLNLAVNKIAPALAAGNTVVHKPALQTSLSALLLPDIFAEAGLPAGVYNLVTGEGAVVGDRLVAGPGVDKIAFTGSTGVGIRTQTAAAAGLKRVTLELGGKNALIVLADAVRGPDADLDRLVETIFQAAFFNCGQFCMGCSRLIVERGVHDELVEALVARIGRARVGDPFDAATQVGPLAHQAQFDKVRQYVDISRREGARVQCGGEPLTVAATGGRGYFHELTLLTGVTPAMRVAQEEIFGPVLSVLRADDADHAVRIANAVPYGLSAGVATTDLTRAHLIAHRLQAGMVWVNTWAEFTARTPFGGYKKSGYGRELGPEGIDEYLQTKTVYLHLGA